MGEALFLVLQLPGSGVITAETTAKHPGSRVDAISFDAESGFAIASISVARGFAPDVFDQMFKELGARYGPARLLSSDVQARHWVYINQVKDTNALAQQLKFLVRLRQDFGLWWNHMSGGQYELRAELRNQAAANEAIGRLRSHYQRLGIPPTISLRTLPAAELAIRDELTTVLHNYRLGVRGNVVPGPGESRTPPHA